MISCDIAVSLDGFVAGPNQSQEEPLGEGGEELHFWQFEDADNNRPELDGILGHGAYIMGRNMFGPIRGEWTGDWRGWWGEDPPYHAPVFVLTHHEREPIEMQGGTTFHFVTGGPEAALALAREAAGERSISIAGGASTVRQYLRLGAIDELRIHLAPVVLGSGASLWDGLAGYNVDIVSARHSPMVTHITYRMKPKA